MILLVIFLINVGMVVGTHSRAAIANNQFDGANPFRFLQGAGAADTLLDCRVVDECSLCDAVSRKEVPECSPTGRIERLICKAPKDGDDEEEGSSSGVFASQSMYRSCLRTKADDEFLMVGNTFVALRLLFLFWMYVTSI